MTQNDEGTAGRWMMFEFKVKLPNFSLTRLSLMDESRRHGICLFSCRTLGKANKEQTNFSRLCFHLISWHLINFYLGKDESFLLRGGKLGVGWTRLWNFRWVFGEGWTAVLEVLKVKLEQGQQSKLRNFSKNHFNPASIPETSSQECNTFPILSWCV
jgi:hypothetical protein